MSHRKEGCHTTFGIRDPRYIYIYILFPSMLTVEFPGGIIPCIFQRYVETRSDVSYKG